MRGARALAGTLVRGFVQGCDALAGPRVSVLTFHRVQPTQDPLFPLEMFAERFDALMALVARAFNVLTLGQAHEALSRGNLPARALVITFDDGYADNATVALPILQRHGLRATFFVSTGFLDGGRMWNDTVIETVRACPLEALDLSEFGLGVRSMKPLNERRQAIDALLPHIKYQSLSGRETLIARLRQLAGDPRLPEDLMMSSEQVRLLYRSGMEIGGHTVQHPILTELPDAAAAQEISTGRQQLEQLIGAPISVFAYPNGVPNRDYARRHADMVRELGFRCAVTTAPGVVRAGAPDHQWPRFTPWDAGDARWVMRLLHQRYRRHPAVLAH